MERLNRTFLLKACAYKCCRVGLSKRGRLSKGWGTGEWLYTGKNVRIPQEGDGNGSGERKWWMKQTKDKVNEQGWLPSGGG